MPDDEAQIGRRVVDEIKRTIWRLQFVGTETTCSSAFTTGRMDDGTEIEVIVRGVRHGVTDAR